VPRRKSQKRAYPALCGWLHRAAKGRVEYERQAAARVSGVETVVVTPGLSGSGLFRDLSPEPSRD
jgi:hypothetical protein